MTIWRLAVFLALGTVALAADWPAYRHDARRSAITAEKLAFPLRLAWEYHCAQPPSPAWPPPHLIMLNRLDFDYAAPVVAAGGVVCFGSSADDAIRALDVKTGAEKWHFITGGPVRFAPQIALDKVYAASDDGFIYCLDLATGRMLWTFRAAPEPDQMVGNHRMISRWPVRTGVLVDGGVVYVVAGMWATEGVYAYALEVQTGKMLWCNDTLGFVGTNYNKGETNADNVEQMAHGAHSGDFGVWGLCPQGALAANSEVLVVPNGYDTPAGIDRKTGRLLYGAPTAGRGGTWLTVDDQNCYTISRHRSNATLVVAMPIKTGAIGGRLKADGIPQLVLFMPRNSNVKRDSGKVSFIIENGKPIARRAFGMVKTAGALILGDEATVRAVDPETEREFWRATVDGEAREFAVADGRLFVSTIQGTIYCFESGSGVSPLRVSEQSGGGVSPLNSSDQRRDASATILAQLHQAGMDRGFALVVGDPDGKLSLELAAQTQLQIINALTDGVAATTLREKLLAQTTWSGSRIHVQTVARLAQLPFAQYFANAVIVVGTEPELSGKELYRVLRPAGGLLIMPGLKPADADALIKESGATVAESRAEGGRPMIVRGRLPGALDWDTKLEGDHAARWPLRPLWFGGPSTAQVTAVVSAGNAKPLAAAGRYFVIGEETLSGVDAYNGTVLWTRPIPKPSPGTRVTDGLIYHGKTDAADDTKESADAEDAPNPKRSADRRLKFARSLRISADTVFLGLGEGVFRDKGAGCVLVDSRNGEQRKIYGPAIDPKLVSLKTPQTWTIAVDAGHSGTVTLAQDAAGLMLQLTTKDPVVTKFDEWDLYFDLRPPESRFGLYGRSTFHLRIRPAVGKDGKPTWIRGVGIEHATPELTGSSEKGSTSTTVRIPWAEIERVAGTRPKSFGFAVGLNSGDNVEGEGIIRRKIFADVVADDFNNGWATVILDDSAPDATPGYKPAVIAGPLSTMPSEPVASNWPKGIDPAVSALPRIHPLTGEPGPRIFRTGTGACGGPDFSATAVVKRSGSAKLLGVYDFVDDSGFRAFNGVSAACGSSTLISQGLVISSEAKARCVCTYPYRTSIALAPAERRLNEDWAIFYERDVDTQVRMASINLGAFGDRRDEQGTLWLGFPRVFKPDEAFGYPKLPGTVEEALIPGIFPLATSASIKVPLKIEGFDKFALYRFNSDRVAIKNTDRPWIYASGYRGIRSAILQLDFLKRLISKSCDRPPQVDGQLNEGIWSEPAQVELKTTRTSIKLRHDGTCLYVAASHPVKADRFGKGSPAVKKKKGQAADIFDEDSLELFFTDTTVAKVAHLVVSVSGARLTALRDAVANKDEDRAWKGDWTGKASTDDRQIAFEVAIPWKTLTDAGLKKESLRFNAMLNQPLGAAAAGEAIVALGFDGRARCRNFVPLGLDQAPVPAPRSFTVRLHFAEPDENVKPGQRVFDVKLQDQIVLKDFDVVKEAGGARTALVKEFKNIRAGEALTIEFHAANKNLTVASVPILSALEVHDEGFNPPVVGKLASARDGPGHEVAEPSLRECLKSKNGGLREVVLVVSNVWAE